MIYMYDKDFCTGNLGFNQTLYICIKYYEIKYADFSDIGTEFLAEYLKLQKTYDNVVCIMCNLHVIPR